MFLLEGSLMDDLKVFNLVSIDIFINVQLLNSFVYLLKSSYTTSWSIKIVQVNKIISINLNILEFL